MLKGVYTALVSPFKNGKLDIESYQSLLKQQLEGGIDGFVVNGTTAESPCLDWSEVEASFMEAKKIVKNNEPIILGCGSNSTEKTIQLAKKSEALGADALLVVVPYYNKPSQEGMYQHFKAVHDNTSTPIIIYNIPGRCVVSMNPDTMKSLSDLDRIVSVKDATGSMDVYKNQRQAFGDALSLLSGDDSSYVDFSLLGGDGCISVLSHLIPDKMKDWLEKAKTGDKTCIDDYKKYDRLAGLLFKEPNPAPTKYALKKMGIIQTAEVRLPMITCSEPLQKEIDQELSSLGLI